MKRIPAPPLLFVLAAALSMSGCPCETQCSTQADAYAECLGEWGMTWTDVGWAGIEQYEEDCKEEVKLERGRRSDSEQIRAANDCAEMNTLLRDTDDCEALYDELSALDGGE